jgi:hypothetical protein
MFFKIRTNYPKIELSQRGITGAALCAPARVESAAFQTSNVHRPREPASDQRARAQNADQHRGVQKEILQLLRTSMPVP